MATAVDVHGAKAVSETPRSVQRDSAVANADYAQPAIVSFICIGTCRRRIELLSRGATNDLSVELFEPA